MTPPPGSETAPSGRVLIVATGSGTADLIGAELTRAGYTLTVCEESDATVTGATFEGMDVVLLEWHPPAHDNVNWLARIQTVAPGLPVLAIAPTELAADSVARALEMGADDYIAVPFHPAILRARVGAAVDRRRLRGDVQTNLQKLQQLSYDLQDVILPLGVSLTTEKDTDLLLEKILLEAKKLCHADAGTLYVRTRDDRLKFSIMLTDSLGIALGGRTGQDIPFPPLRLKDPETGEPNHRNIATHVALHGHSVNIADIYGSEAFDFSGTREFDKRNNYRSISTLTVPLKDNADTVIAVLQLLNALDPATREVTSFDSYKQLVVESLASQAAVVFNNQLLLQRQEELLKFERDLQIGRQIQQGFLPETLPSPEGYQIAARFQPAREVAGDFYDAFMLGPDTMGFVVADVCDKGVGAALFMALVRSLVRVYSQQRYSVLAAEAVGASPGAMTAVEDGPAAVGVTGKALQQAVILTNDYIGENHLNMNMFATMFAGVLNLKTGAMAYVNGGHNAPILLTTSGSTVRMPSKSPAVGMMPGFQFSVAHAHVNPGDLLVVFSDGIPDARDPHHKFFTETRLLRMVEETSASRSAEQVAADIQEALAAHISTAAQFDDITLMVIRRDANAG
ncbi:MAG TPA: SpoIIE family protein phosphatase [Vicinamibacterales bacterium]|nr:SpoIIE family protein phosphatase [Vicinamibacterales bacterium]